MKKYQSEGDFVEASLLKKKITELKFAHIDQQEEELYKNQAQQKIECEEAHKAQYEAFNKQWDEDLLTTQAEDAQTLEQLDAKHTAAFEKNKKDLEEKLPLTFKFSPALLNLNKIQANFAKQEKYEEARDV